MTGDRFSRRYGHGPDEKEITVREDAPAEVRGGLLVIAEGELGIRPRFIRSVLCAVVRKLPDQGNWSEYPNIWGECQYLLEDCPWYRVYDFVEALYRRLLESPDSERAEQWEAAVNDFFVETGVGWRMTEGSLETRGPEAFQTAVDTARRRLDEAALPTARQEIHEALRDLSRRPAADLTGAIQHSMAALECTLREAAGDPRATLGEILKRNPGLLPRPLDDALARLWGYASETARHLREGRSIDREEAELLVGVAASACTYLAAKLQP